MSGNLEEREKLLLEAYDEAFCETLEQVRVALEIEIRRLAEQIAAKLDSLLGCHLIVEARVKSRDSFTEKLKRKGYLDSWEVANDKESNQELIRKNLPDLIGLRLNCMFLQQERAIYEALRTADCDLRLDFSTPTKMRNGRDVYKVTGSYEWPDDKLRYNFELQIKSYINNLWGEVEHKVRYKSSRYSIDEQLKESVTKQTITVLEATDSQLQKLYEHAYDENDLVKGLFYLFTKDAAAKACQTNILAEHYERFFTLMFNSESSKIRQFVSSKLADQQYAACAYKTSNTNKTAIELAYQIALRYNNYCLETLYQIASNLNTYDENLSGFLVHLATVRLDETADDFDDEGLGNDAFSEGETPSQTTVDAQLKYLDGVFEYYLLGRPDGTAQSS